MRVYIKFIRLFQSTLPVRGATAHANAGTLTVSLFQSTLPVRGATVPLGCGGKVGRNFNPRSPCGERQGHGQTNGIQNDFNPRSPCGERPAGIVFVEEVFSISIHAPRAGSDLADVQNYHQLAQFQSTLPVRGATAIFRCLVIRVKIFQSTLRVRGATEPIL